MPTAAEERRPGSTGEGEAAEVARAYFDAVAARDPDAMAACWTPEGVDELHGVATLIAPDGVREWFSQTFAAMPDFKMVVLEVIASGEKAAVHWHMTGTFTGPGRFEGLLPTGASLDVRGCDVLYVHEGLIHRNDAYMNGAQMARQLGVLPPQDSGPERAMIRATNLKTRAAGLLRRR
jgi:steroid delta-isomerase-like uncharacterized protein